MPIKLTRTEIAWQCEYCHKKYDHDDDDYSWLSPKDLHGLAKTHEAECYHNPSNRRCITCGSGGELVGVKPSFRHWIPPFGCIRSSKPKADGDTCRYWSPKKG